MIKNYQIIFYVPLGYCEVVKETMFEAGAGKVGNYEACAFQTKGEGQFRPIKEANPFLGEKDKLEKVAEYKVEMLCMGDKLEGAVKAMKKAHPYEEVAYGVFEMLEV
ncbi:MAG: Unknown protein [uncultured Sulfurovum sp.]|uniref:NGG1p interacting factor NIF3 n=1 Tax=uncultured Sulfurovum sp. TaxID=269237 RepID=A0A6S6TW19_9BACT|nr:MAG: Unknown protein [uncultured Sulfurovum sp.]